MDFQPIPMKLRARARIALQIMQDPEWLQREAEFFVSGDYGEESYKEWNHIANRTRMNRVAMLSQLLFSHGFGLCRDRVRSLYKCLTEEQQKAANATLEKVIQEASEV